MVHFAFLLFARIQPLDYLSQFPGSLLRLTGDPSRVGHVTPKLLQDVYTKHRRTPSAHRRKKCLGFCRSMLPGVLRAQNRLHAPINLFKNIYQVLYPSDSLPVASAMLSVSS